MALTATASNHAKYQFHAKAINLASDSIKALLMRSGFVFDKDKHATKINLMTNSGAHNLTFDDGTKTITADAGDFVADGFVIGNKITTDAVLNPGPFTITDVTTLVITVSEAVVDEGPVLKTVTSNDELATGFGYNRDTKVLTGQTVTEGTQAEMTCGSITWTASGGTIGPTPGCILYDDTSGDDTILGYLDFNGEQSVTDPDTLTIQNLKIQIA